MFDSLPNVIYSMFIRLTTLSAEKYIPVLQMVSALGSVETFVTAQSGIIEFKELFCSVTNSQVVGFDGFSVQHCLVNLKIYHRFRLYDDIFTKNLQEIHQSYITDDNAFVVKNTGREFIKIEIVPNIQATNEIRSDMQIVYSSTVPYTEFAFTERPTQFDLDTPLSCPMVSIPLGSIHISLINELENTIALNEDFIVNQSRWFSDNEQAYICAEEYRQFQDSIQSVPLAGEYVTDPEIIVSIVCSSVSIVSLLITILTYVIHQSLRRTMPGKNLISLCGALMFAQIVYLVVNLAEIRSGSTYCQIAGVLVHFSWLLAVFWMSVCTFHMFYVLTTTKKVTESSVLTRYMVYVVYTFGCSIVFISLTIFLSSKIYGHFGYGKNSCYISSQVVLYFTFGLPLALVMISNLCMYIAVMVKIKRTGTVSRNVQNDRNEILIFVKLSTITGTTWIFGFIYLWTSIVVFSYIFIVLNASQGLFLCFAFVTNRRVLAMYKKFSSRESGLTLRSKPTLRSSF